MQAAGIGLAIGALVTTIDWSGYEFSVYGLPSARAKKPI